MIKIYYYGRNNFWQNAYVGRCRRGDECHLSHRSPTEKDYIAAKIKRAKKRAKRAEEARIQAQIKDEETKRDAVRAQIKAIEDHKHALLLKRMAERELRWRNQQEKLRRLMNERPDILIDIIENWDNIKQKFQQLLGEK